MSEVDDFADLFAPETDSAPASDAGEAWKVLLVDDEPDIHAVLRLALQGLKVDGRPLQLLDARSAEEARLCLSDTPDIALVLLDVVMESERAGLELVRFIRQELANHSLQILLVTGQPGYAPQRDVVVAYEINGYRLKSELTDDKIFVSVHTALRSFQILNQLEQQRRQTESLAQSLLEREAHLRSVVETAPDAIIIADMQGNVTDWNSGARQLFGYTVDEILGQSVCRLMPERFLAAHSNAMAAIRAGNPPHLLGKIMEIEILHKHGQIVPAEIVLGSWSNAAGYQFSAVIRNIVQRKAIELELEQHRHHLEEQVAARTLELEASNTHLAQLEFAIDRVGVGVVWHDPVTSRFLDANNEACQQLGYSLEALCQLSVSDINPDYNPQQVVETLEITRKSGGIAKFETRHRRKDGTLFPVEVVLYPLTTADGDKLIAFWRDISERKRTEQKLLEAKASAEAASQAKSVFLANMSHELRTPLNAVLGFSSLLCKENQLTPSQREKLNIINRSGEHLLTLINNVLEMSKIEAERLQLELAPFDLGLLIREIADLMQIRAREKGLGLIVDQSPNCPRYILGDEARLRQVLINLVGNAVKFTEQGDVTVRVDTQQRHRLYLLIAVEDAGAGIPKQDIERIFQPFVQLGEHSINQGTGLGLAISRQYIHLMGGTITVESEPGKGSIFRVELPIETVADGPKPFDHRQILGPAPNQPAYRILIVEDQVENQLLLTQLMQPLGLQVELAENGLQALERFQSWHPDLIWMDRRMPVMDGIEATRAIRRLPGGKAVKIVAVTASAFVEQRNEMLDAGIDDFVLKPYRIDEIYLCLSRQLGMKYRYAESPTPPAPEAVKLTAARMAVLPQNLRFALFEALSSLDSDRIGDVVAQVADYDPGLQETLSLLADNFDYPAILKALQAK